MKQSLQEAMDNKAYCQLQFHDGTMQDGYITRLSRGTFDIMVFEYVGEDNSQEISFMSWGEEEETKPKGEEKSVDRVMTKHTYEQSYVCGIVHDVSHRIDPKTFSSMQFLRDTTLYKEVKTTPKKKKTTRSVNKVQKDLTK